VTLNEATAGPMKEGETRAGFLGEGNIIRKPDYVAQDGRTAEDKARKKALQTILGQTIEPNALSSKSSPAMDRRALVNKLSRGTLEDLLRLCPERLKDMTIGDLQEVIAGTVELSEWDKAEIQNLYMDVSP